MIFLCRIVHVAEIKSLFLEFAQEAKIQEKLDPMYENGIYNATM